MKLVSISVGTDEVSGKKNISIVTEEKRFLVFKRRRIFTSEVNDLELLNIFATSRPRPFSWIERCNCGECGFVRSVDLVTSEQLDRWANDKNYRRLWDKSRGAAKGIVWPDPPPRTEGGCGGVSPGPGSGWP